MSVTATATVSPLILHPCDHYYTLDAKIKAAQRDQDILRAQPFRYTPPMHDELRNRTVSLRAMGDAIIVMRMELCIHTLKGCEKCRVWLSKQP